MLFAGTWLSTLPGDEGAAGDSGSFKVITGSTETALSHKYSRHVSYNVAEKLREEKLRCS